MSLRIVYQWVCDDCATKREQAQFPAGWEWEGPIPPLAFGPGYPLTYCPSCACAHRLAAVPLTPQAASLTVQAHEQAEDRANDPQP